MIKKRYRKERYGIIFKEKIYIFTYSKKIDNKKNEKDYY